MTAGLRTAVVALVVTMLLAAPASADTYAPGTSPFGKTYGEWNAQWWSTMGQNLLDPFASGEVKCSGVNDGRVVFLAGTFGGSATRSCKIPSSKAILFPLINAFCSDAAASEADLRACAAGFADSANSLQASVDGAAIPNLFSYRAPSPLFTFTTVAGNALGYPVVSEPAVADGFYVMVKPLARGPHTVTFGGSTASGFSTLATYNLTVVK
jgi:hypothetical protein